MNRRQAYRPTPMQVLDHDFDLVQDLAWWHTSRLASLAVAARTGLAEGEEEPRLWNAN